MSEHTTVAPSAAGQTAIARPLPELDPVTTATLLLDVFHLKCRSLILLSELMIQATDRGAW